MVILYVPAGIPLMVKFPLASELIPPTTVLVPGLKRVMVAKSTGSFVEISRTVPVTLPFHLAIGPGQIGRKKILRIKSKNNACNRIK